MQQNPTYSFVPLGQKKPNDWWRWLVVPFYAIALAVTLVATLVAVGVAVVLNKFAPNLAQKFNRQPQEFKKPTLKKEISSPSTQTSKVQLPVIHFNWQKFLPIGISGVLALAIGVEIWWLNQPKVAPETLIEVINEEVVLTPPAGFVGCDIYQCTTLPYGELASYQQNQLALAQETASARVFLSLALSYFYQGNTDKYQQYLLQAQVMDPSVMLTWGETSAQPQVLAQ